MTVAAAVVVGAAVVLVDTVVLPPVGVWLVVPVLTVVFGVVSVAGVPLVLLGSVGVRATDVLVVTPEVVAEGLGLLVCPVGFTVPLPGEVTEEGSIVLVTAVVAVVVEVLVVG